MTRAYFGLSVLIIFSSCVPQLMADTWKCTMDSGETQYTAVPDPDANCHPIQVQPSSTPAKAETKPPVETVNASADQGTKASRDEAEDIQRISRENCQRAQANLQLLNSSTRIRLKEGDQYRVIPEAERREKIALAQEQIDTFCE